MPGFVTEIGTFAKGLDEHRLPEMTQPSGAGVSFAALYKSASSKPLGEQRLSVPPHAGSAVVNTTC
jgi:hypothetical protein